MNREYEFNFGKHKGKTLGQIPLNYIQWCIDEGVAKQRDDLLQALVEYQVTRGPAVIPTLLSFEERKQALRRKLPAWFYDECEKAFDKAFDHELQALWPSTALRQLEHDKLDALEEMARVLAPRYPPRPSEAVSLPDSASLDELRAVLALLPESAWDIEELYQGLGVDATNSVMVHHDGDTGREFIGLTAQRKEYIKRCLEAIEREHGKDVRCLANWEVRDKVRSDTSSGICYAS